MSFHNIKVKLFEKPTWIDVTFLSAFVIAITFQPFFIHGTINIFEVGLYLPGIQAVLDGQVPFRDFFHLRGPLELYVPALMMKVAGVNLQNLYLYFYLGTVACLIFGVWIAKELILTRLVLYTFVPVFVARTFPRVVFTYWGGMRFALGLLAVWMLIKFFQKGKGHWLFLSGITCALGLLTSIEIGICTIAGLTFALIISVFLKMNKKENALKALLTFLTGLFLILIPYTLYLMSQHALLPYLDAIYTVVTKMEHTLDPHFVSIYPRNFVEASQAMLNPFHTNFKHMTPSYLYLFLAGYLIYRIKYRIFDQRDLMLTCLGTYGFIMYNTSFRAIWAQQFEMSLQPEKILLFAVIDIFLVMLWNKREVFVRSLKAGINVSLVYALIFSFLASSVGYSIARYNHRFFAFQYIFGKDISKFSFKDNKETRPLNIDRAKGIIVENAQADELEAVERYTKEYIAPKDLVLTFPELGTYNFLFDRMFAGRFPLVTLSWFKEDWHEQVMNVFRSKKAKYIFLQKDLGHYWEDVYLATEANRQKFQEALDFIHTNYEVVEETPATYILKLKSL
jgi:hypothetical protein